MEFEIEDRPQSGFAQFGEQVTSLCSIQRRRLDTPRRPNEIRDRAIIIPDQEVGS